MPASITTAPTYAVPNRRTSVIITPGNGSANFVRLWVTTAPEGTAFRKRIDASKLRRDLAYQGPPGALHPWRFTFEKGGAYALTLQEYERGNAWGGGYEGDPRGAPSETKLGGEQLLTLYISQRVTQAIGVSPDTATLVLFISNATVRPTSIAVHGEASPAIIGPSSDKAAAAVGDSVTSGTDLYTALNALSNDTVVGIGGTVDADLVNGLRAAFGAHAASGTFHEDADADNSAAVSGAAVQTGEVSLAAFATAVNRIRQLYTLHILNSNESSPTPGSVAHHNQGSITQDLPHQLLPITADASDAATIFAAIADLVRAYELHRVASLHETADNTNTMSLAARALALVHRRFLECLTEAQSPPAGQTTGVQTLTTFAGFEET